MRATRITLKNWMGIESKAFDIGEGGVLIKGKNKSGKTSILQAFVSALTGAGIDPNHIRTGADKSEILIDFADPVAQVRRVARRSGNNGLETDGIGLGKQQTKLNELLGPSISPMALLNAKPAERRKMILEAMPAPVTAEDLLRWTGDKWEPDPSRHGLEVIADVRKHYYDLRTKANADAKEATGAADRAQVKVDELAAKAPTRALTIEAAREELTAAKNRKLALEQRDRQATEQEEKSQGTRKRIAALRKEAVDLETTGPVVPPLSEWTALCETLDSAAVEVSSLKARLAQAEEALEVARAAAIEYKRRQEAGNENARQMSQKLQQASDLELSLDSTIIASPSPEDFRAADDDVVAATDLVTNAEAWQAELDARAECERLTTGALVAIGRAEALNAIVENLTTAAPAELAARSVTIKGLTFTEDGGIALDGVVLDLISGNEGINFCVQVAKRAHPKCKILTVNGLEALDPEELEAFVRFATADGWQLIGTKVQGGELVIELLEAT